MEASEPAAPHGAYQRRTLTVPGALESLELVRDFIAASALALGIPERDAYGLQLAADEACTNIVQHGMPGPPAANPAINLELSAHEAGWTLTIRDRGRSFDPASFPTPDLKSGLRRRRPGGLGVYLMRSLMDDVRYCSSGDENCLIMTKRRS